MGQLASKRAVEEDPLTKKRREIKERGVLIPPTFGVVSGATPSHDGEWDGHSVVGGSPPDDDVPPLSSEFHHLQTRLSSRLVPSLLSDLSAHDLSNRILRDHMQAGFWLSTSTAASASSSPRSGDKKVDEAAVATAPSRTAVKAGFQVADGSSWGDRPFLFDASTTRGLVSGGLITMRHMSRDHRWHARMCVGTDLVAAPSATAAYNVLSPARSPHRQLVLMGHGSANGGGWVGAHGSVASIGQQRMLGNVQVGSWVAGGLGSSARPRTFPFAPTESSSTTGLSRLGSAAESLGAYAAADFLGSTAALEVQCQLPSASGTADSSIPQLQTRSYFSINLSDEHRSADSTGPPPPPLVVTLERSGGGSESDSFSTNDGTVLSALSISQVLHLDRYQINPLEDRAPKIRNTMAWTIRLERVAAAAAANVHSSGARRFLRHDEAYGDVTTTTDDPSAAKSTTRLAVGGAWQINRAVAVKAVATPDALTTALVLRRWKEPRVTCSLLFRNSANQEIGSGSPSSSSSSSLWRPRFVGIGLQVETGDDLYSGNNHYADQRRTAFGAAGVSSPETKATLPY